MPSMSDLAFAWSQSLVMSWLVKATLILIAGMAVTQLARKARASVRHLVIASSFAALVALPALLALTPAMTIDVPVTVSPATMDIFEPRPFDVISNVDGTTYEPPSL